MPQRKFWPMETENASDTMPVLAEKDAVTTQLQVMDQRPHKNGPRRRLQRRLHFTPRRFTHWQQQGPDMTTARRNGKGGVGPFLGVGLVQATLDGYTLELGPLGQLNLPVWVVTHLSHHISAVSEG